MTSETELSEREIEILRLLATGASNKEIAVALVISPNTVKVHLRNIFAKIGAASRTEATLTAMRMGLVEGVSEARPPEDLSAVGGQSGLLTTLPEAAAQASAPPAPWWQSGWRVGLLVALAAAVVLLGILLTGNGITPGQVAPTPPQPTAGQAAAPQRWQNTLALPEARSGMASAAFESALYIFGGVTPGGISPASLRFSPTTNAWEVLSAKPTPVSEAQAAVLGEMIFIPGGRLENGQPSPVLEAYSPRLNRWEKLAPLPRALCGYALAAFEGDLYLFGGWDGLQYTNTVYVYDPDSNQWQTRNPMQMARGYAAAVTLEGRIFVIGGFDGQNALSSVQVYYPSRERAGANPWEERAPLPEGRYAMGAATLVNMIYVLGGESEPPSQSGLAPLQYLPLSNQWMRFERAPQVTGSKVTLLALDTRLHVIGGQTPSGLSAAHQTYQAIYTISLPSVQN